jgi:hypothetical protein
VALYHFDETSGTTSADPSGNGNTATMVGGATFSPGVRGNAATFRGANQYAMLPIGIVSALTNFSISAWINQSRGAVGYGDRLSSTSALEPRSTCSSRPMRTRCVMP